MSGPNRALLEDSSGHPLAPDGRRLTDEQAAVVADRDGPMIVAANAGSGKTTVLVERFVRYVVDDEVDPRAILAITFTRRAAGELRRRIRERFLQLDCRDHAQAMEAAWISTIDGFCLRVLSAHAVVAGLDPALVVLDPAELRPLREQAFEDALAELLGTPGNPPPPGALELVDRFGYGTLRETIASAYDTLRTRGQARPHLPVPEAPSAADAPHLPALQALDALLAAYGESFTAGKRALRGLDYADLALAVLELFRARPEIAAGYAQRLQRVMVDELQDTNPLQVELLEALGQQHLFGVGDRLQSIYAFRHADVRGFDRLFERAERAGRAHTLASNFRSAPPILDVINEALGPSHPGYVPLRTGLESEDGHDAAVELLMTDAVAWKSLPEADPLAAALTAGMPPGSGVPVIAEARLVAQRVRALLDEGRPAGDVVVLLRAGTHMAAYERALELAGVPAVATQGRGWWSRREVQDLLSHLRVVGNPLDEPALVGALAAPFAGLGTDDLARLALERRDRGTSMWDAVLAAADGDRDGHLERIGDETREALGAYAALVARDRRTAAADGPAALLQRAVEESGYDVHVLQGPGGLRRLANVRKLIALADAYAARNGPDLRGFVDHAAAELEAGAQTPDAPLDVGADQAVRLMTVHGAKGLEFPVVIVADLGREGGGGPPALLVDGDRVGLRLPGRHGDDADVTFDYEALDAERVEAEVEEERRIMHVAVTRAEELLILSGTFKADKGWGVPGHKRPALAWMGPGLFGSGEDAFPPADGLVQIGPAQARVVVSAPGGPLSLGAEIAAQPAQAVTHPPAVPADVVAGLERPGAPAPPTLSYSSLAAHARCGYSWYLRRVLGLPERRPRPAVPGDAGDGARRRGSIAHALLERVPLHAGAPAPGPEAVRAAALAAGEPLADDEIDDQLRLAAAFLDGPWRERIATAELVRRETQFALAFGEGEDAPLLIGVVDLLAHEPGGGVLVVDHKTDRVAAEADLEALVARDYAIQRAAYALAALRAGAGSVEVAHLYLDRGAAVSVRYEAADAGRLEQEIAEVAGPLLRGEHAVAAEPHLGLCARCPGRGGLCPQPPELTDRPDPAAG